jgi:uncharacterized protein Yka (UPF0111/DUF47 family)
VALLPRTAQRPYDAVVFDLLTDAGRNGERAGALLRELLGDPLERSELAEQLVACEHEGDRITHDIIHRMDGEGQRPRVPFDSVDGHRLATALDDIVDHTEEAGDRLGLYGIEAPMEQALTMADLLVEIAAEVTAALEALRDGDELQSRLVEIHRIENEADRVSRDAIGALFAGGIDPMVVIRWKDIFDALEAAVDACETVAHVLEGIALRRR